MPRQGRGAVQGRMLGMLSPWMEEAHVALTGSVFAHDSWRVLTDASQPWLTSSLKTMTLMVTPL